MTYQNASRISQTTVHSSYNQMKNNKSASYFPSPIKVCASKSRKRAEKERKTRDFSPSLIRDLWHGVLVDSKTKNLDGTGERKKDKRDKTFRQMTISSLPRPSVCLSSATHSTTQHTLKKLKGHPGLAVVLQHKSLCPSFCCSKTTTSTLICQHQ